MAWVVRCTKCLAPTIEYLKIWDCVLCPFCQKLLENFMNENPNNPSQWTVKELIEMHNEVARAAQHFKDENKSLKKELIEKNEELKKWINEDKNKWGYEYYKNENEDLKKENIKLHEWIRELREVIDRGNEDFSGFKNNIPPFIKLREDYEELKKENEELKSKCNLLDKCIEDKTYKPFFTIYKDYEKERRKFILEINKLEKNNEELKIRLHFCEDRFNKIKNSIEV